jgi:hypothetical protein
MKKIIDNRTPEEMAIDQFKLTNEIRLIPEPNRFFEIGEEVSIGNLKGCKIIKPAFNGKAYFIRVGEDIQIWSWLNIFKIKNRENSLFKNSGLRLNYIQTGISEILIKIYHFGLEMNPDYQRDYVWSQEDKENLIDSIFNNRDIGKFVFVILDYEENKPAYEILDGKQRVNALREFYEDKLLYKGLKFSELSNLDRRRFEDYGVSVCEVKDSNLKQKLNIFYQINISGKVMDNEHLEKIKKEIDKLEVKNK